MNILIKVITVFFVFIVTSSTSVYAESDSLLETVAIIPSNGFNENLFQTSDGSIYVTGAFEGNLWKISGNGHVEKFAAFPDHAMILRAVYVNSTFVLGAHKRAFRTPEGIDFSNIGSQVILLDQSGNITATVSGNKGDVFNGMALDGQGKVLITDSLAATIWQFDPVSRKLSLWFKDDVLSTTSITAVGANGIKVVNGWVYVANKARESVHRIRITPAGDPKGPFLLVADGLPGADDFAVAPDGTVYMPPPKQGAPLIRILPDGQVEEFIESAPSGASAIVSNDGKWLYWATGREPKEQRLVRVAIP